MKTKNKILLAIIFFIALFFAIKIFIMSFIWFIASAAIIIAIVYGAYLFIKNMK
jgi:hypothetical protein